MFLLSQRLNNSWFDYRIKNFSIIFKYISFIFIFFNFPFLPLVIKLLYESWIVPSASDLESFSLLLSCESSIPSSCTMASSSLRSSVSESSDCCSPEDTSSTPCSVILKNLINFPYQVVYNLWSYNFKYF